MLQISDRLREIFKNDRLPGQQALKDLELHFPDLGIIIEYDKILNNTFELTERLCSSNELVFGSCEGANAKITVADIPQDLKNQACIVKMKVHDPLDDNIIYEMPLGTYKVESAILQNDKRFKELTMRDSMQKFNAEVSEWYNSLSFPLTLKNFRESLLTHLKIEYEEQILPNDNIEVEKTINTSSLIGFDVIRPVCELHGGFGQFTRLDKFKVVGLSGLGLYPSESLYPSEDLYPSESGEYLGGDTTFPAYKTVEFEEYTVKPIDKLQINQESGDIGAIVGDGDNAYTITGNFLVFGKSSLELNSIANNVFKAIKDKYYRPHKTEMIGLPYMLPGDAVSFIMTNDTVESYFFIRTLKGTQILTDTVEAKGKESRTNSVGLNTQITQLKGKANILTRNVDELSSTITNVEKNLESKFEQLEDSVSITVDDMENDIRGQIKVLSEEVELKVDSRGVITAINLSDGIAKIKADKIELEGTVTANGNFKINTDGTIEAINGKFSGIVEGATIKGSAFETYGNDGYFISSAWDSNQHGTWNLEVRIQNGEIEVGRTLYTTTGQTFEKSTTINYNSISTNKVYGTSVQGESADFKEMTLGTTGGAGKVIFNSSYEFRPQVFSTNCKIGSSSYPWTEGHFKKIYANGVEIGTFDEKSIKALYPQSNSNSYYAYLNTSREFIPSTSSSSYPFYLGNLNYPWNTLYVNSIRMVGSGGSLAFFNATPSARKSISKLSNTSSITAGAVADKVNEILTELNSKGLISSS